MKTTDQTTIQDALAMCIEMEQESHEQYSNHAKRTLNLHQKSIWELLANDELRHKSLLTTLSNRLELISEAYIPDANPARLNLLIIEKPINPIKEIFIKAINTEIEAYNTYRDIAEQAQTSDIRNLFLILSQEELNHKLILEEELATIG
jgi:rubrerythrin